MREAGKPYQVTFEKANYENNKAFLTKVFDVCQIIKPDGTELVHENLNFDDILREVWSSKAQRPPQPELKKAKSKKKKGGNSAKQKAGEEHAMQQVRPVLPNEVPPPNDEPEPEQKVDEAPPVPRPIPDFTRAGEYFRAHPLPPLPVQRNVNGNEKDEPEPEEQKVDEDGESESQSGDHINAELARDQAGNMAHADDGHRQAVEQPLNMHAAAPPAGTAAEMLPPLPKEDDPDPTPAQAGPHRAPGRDAGPPGSKPSGGKE